jgi:hypothetical protein
MWWLIIPTVSLTTALLLGRLLERASVEQTRPAQGALDSRGENTARDFASSM